MCRHCSKGWASDGLEHFVQSLLAAGPSWSRWPLLGLLLVALMAYARTRGLLLRVLSLAFLLAALANPTIRSEEREPLTDIAVAVIDRSLSQENGERIATHRRGRGSTEAGRGAPSAIPNSAPSRCAPASAPMTTAPALSTP